MKKVEIFTRDMCAFCEQAKNLLKQKNIPFVEYNIWKDETAAADMKKRVPQARTVPQIFIGGTAIGGYTDLAKLNDSGDLAKMVADK
ncbi:MAG: glutathione S-transferase N-terminal domain-containing protein [Alphaproteobacteria bacterium]|nr:glutathione S-transferase N-terminal domain-containing protein [Alphaproteobacteria bacterium]